jgi:hypothetical protein
LNESNADTVDLTRFMRSFRERFKPMHPVEVRRADLGDDWGDTSIVTRKGEPRFLVRINKALGKEAQMFVLVHELAHTIQWRVHEEMRESDHDAEWGVAYARVWEALFGA